MFDKLIWYLRQLLPLTYRTRYGDETGNQHFVVWNMWFGHQYNVEDVIVADNRIKVSYTGPDWPFHTQLQEFFKAQGYEMVAGSFNHDTKVREVVLAKK